MSETGDLEQAFEDLEHDASMQRVREQNYQLRQALSRQKEEVRVAKGKAKEKEEELEEAHDELRLYNAPVSRTPKWGTPRERKTKEHVGVLNAVLSDTHYGEVVEEGELGGYNKYNMDIAKTRTKAFFENTVKISRNFLAGVKYEGIYLSLGGDLVSGTIHDELTETNELTTFDTVLEVIPWLRAGIEMWLEEFGQVHVVSAPGNHGRNSLRPRHKRRSANNADTHIARLLSMGMSDVPGLTFDIPVASEVDYQIYDVKFTLEHGDDLKFNGTSEIGSLGPVKRGSLRTSRQRQRMGREFDIMVVGHFHQYLPGYTNGFIMNGSLKGYDEYAHRNKFSPEIAQQSLALVTPDNGITMACPIFVMDRLREKW